VHALLNLFLRAVFPPAVGDWIVLGADVLALATIPSVLVQRRGRPLAALSWILALLAIPFGGVVGWWLLGRTHLQRRVRKRQRAGRRMDAEHPGTPPRPLDIPRVIRQILPFALHGDRRWSEGVFPPTEATDVRVWDSGAEAFAAMEAAISGARTEIRALYYIWQTGETGRRIAERMAERARAGVKVRTLVDEVGSRPFLRELAKPLRAAGVEVAGFLPASFRPWAPTFNFRNHRKLLLVDGRVGFIGGMNIGREYEREWSDQCIQLQGPVLGNLDAVFQEDWLFVTNRPLGDMPRPAGPEPTGIPPALCTVIASGPDREEHRVHDGFFLAITNARRRVWLTSPYFIPDASLLDALRAAALRGLDVRILTPRQNDVWLAALASRSCYDQLTRAGGRVFEYLPRFLHTKNLIVDDELSVVGSANVDARSFRLNFELTCFIVSPEVNATLASIFERYCRESAEISRADLQRKGVAIKCLESGANLLSPLL
jgi:cardiolipin synthase